MKAHGLWKRALTRDLHEFSGGPTDDPDTCYAPIEGYEEYGATCGKLRKEHDEPTDVIASALSEAREEGRREERRACWEIARGEAQRSIARATNDSCRAAQAASLVIGDAIAGRGPLGSPL